MTIGEIIGLIANTGGVLGFAIYAVWHLERIWKERLEAERRSAGTIEAMRIETATQLALANKLLAQNTEVLRGNTEVMAHTADVLEELCRKLGIGRD